MDIALVLYDGFTALDAVGPYEVLRFLPEARVRTVAGDPGPKQTDTQMLTVVAHEALTDVPAPDIVVVPGGPGHQAAMRDDVLLSWLSVVHEDTRWTTSVCSGSLILGAAGILRGIKATSHWLRLEQLADHGATPTSERVVVQGRVMTAAGVSAGIDMALRLVAEEAGDQLAQAAQLAIEYDPQPPFDAGSPERAPSSIVDLLRNRDRSAG